MTTLTMRLVKGDFIVTGPDIAPMNSRPAARPSDWCKIHHPVDHHRDRPGRQCAAAETGRYPTCRRACKGVFPPPRAKGKTIRSRALVRAGAPSSPSGQVTAVVALAPSMTGRTMLR